MWYSGNMLQARMVEEVKKLPEGCQVCVANLFVETFGKKMMEDIAWIEMIKLADEFPYLMKRNGIEVVLVEAQQSYLMSPYHLYQIQRRCVLQ